MDAVQSPRKDPPKIKEELAVKCLLEEQSKIIEEFNEFLKRRGIKEILEEYWKLSKRAESLLNKHNQHASKDHKPAVVPFDGINPWGTCCTNHCYTATQAQCANDGGSFTPFASSH
jgi:hypothetical protein